MKKELYLIVILLFSLKSYGQNSDSDFNSIQINKKMKEFPDTFDLSTPLKSCITFNYLSINGKEKLYRSASSLRIKAYLPDSSIPISKVNEENKAEYLNFLLKEVIYYKDSIACVIAEIRELRYSIRTFYFENGRWVNRSENTGNSIDYFRQFFKKYAGDYLKELRSTIAISSVPSDTSSFINYLKQKGTNPKEFVLDKLSKYKLVMYGEIHRRKSSWDVLQEIARDERFAKNIGVIFMEMASHKQKDIDKFFSNDTLDNELLLNVFREYMMDGWVDKGMFDFIICIWHINKNLKGDNKIKIIAADTPRPFSTFQSKDDMNINDAKYDRNEFMANTVISSLESIKDKRNSLFIVGSAHVCKTIESAGSILIKKFPLAIYTIFQHSPRIDNFLSIHERIRFGMFDFAFYNYGDHPIAFELKNSPFGQEPFDGFYSEGTGTYQENYDGYLFFGSLDKEPNGELLLDLYNDNFINEMDRRYRLLGSCLIDAWGLKDLSRNAVLEKVREGHSKTRWENIINPLENGKTIQ